MVRMVVTGEHKYDGVLVRPGDEYDATEKVAAVVRAKGWARDKTPADDKPPVAPEPYCRRDMEAAPAPSTPPGSDEPQPTRSRRRYGGRRDMNAEG